jgi:hypothetical protein
MWGAKRAILFRVGREVETMRHRKQQEFFDSLPAKQKNLLPSDLLRNTRGIDFTLATRPLRGRAQIAGGLLLGSSYVLLGVMGCVCGVVNHFLQRTPESLFEGIVGLLLGSLILISGWNPGECASQPGQKRGMMVGRRGGPRRAWIHSDFNFVY